MDPIVTMSHTQLSDTLYLDTAKLNILKSLITDTTAKTSINLWIPFFSALLGGLLVLLGQGIDRFLKKKQERLNLQLEIYAYCRRLEAELRNSYRALAMAKVHVVYWWYCYQKEGDFIPDSNNYKQHLRSQSEAREIENKIGDSKAAFIAHVRKFQCLHMLKEEIDTSLNEISDLVNPKTEYFDINLDFSKVRDELVQQKEDELRDAYYKNLGKVTSVNDYLQSLIKF